MTRRVLELLGYSCAGGAAESVLELTAEFVRGGVDVTVAAPDEPGFGARVRSVGARFVPVALASRSDWRSFARLVGLLRRERFDVVHTHCRNADLHGGLAARATATPHVAHLRGLLVDGDGGLPTGLVDRCHRALLRRLPRRIVAISEAVRRRALAVLGVAPERIVTVRNGIDVGRMRAPSRSGAAVRAEFAIPADARLLVAIGTLGRCKGQDLLIEALAATWTAPHALLVGDGEARAALTALAERLGVARRVHFAGQRADVRELLHAADLFVHPARWEGFGRVVAEAMAAGRPLVATRVGGIPEIVADGVTGRLVEPGQPLALAGAIDALLEDPLLAQRLGAAAQSFAQRELDAATTARGVARVLFESAAGAPLLATAEAQP
jgi:glycosyltransferase involved in cell wall biosynthesis